MLYLLSVIRNRLFSFWNMPRSFGWFAGGFSVSRIGDAIYNFAIPWISYQLTGSVLVMSSLYAVSVLPVVLFGPFAGVLIDRLNRKKLMIGIDAVRAVLIAFIPVLHALDLLEVWHLYFIAFALSILTMAYDVSVVAITPKLADGQLTKANAGIQTISSLADMTGPVIAGVLTTLMGAFQMLWLDVVSFAAILSVLIKMPYLPETKTGPRKAVLKEMSEGFNWLIKNPLNLSLSIQAAVGNFGYSAAYAVLMFDLISVLHLGSRQIGVNYSLLALGGVIGSLAVVYLEKRVARNVVIPSLLAFGTAGFLTAALCPLWFAPGLGFAIVGACNVAWSIISSSVRQETVPSHLLGRVLSFSRVLTRIAMPIGALLGGIMTEHFDPFSVFLLAAGAKAAEIAIASFSPIRTVSKPVSLADSVK